MNRITETFERLKREGRKGFVGFLTSGDPDLETSRKDILITIENGVDILELGVPFSDPTADGPTIQAAAHRALASGMTLEKTLDLVRGIREVHDLPIILFGYANPFFRYGYERLCRDAAEAGVDGLLIVDLPFEEAGEIRPFMKANGLALIPLVAPTTPEDRVGMIVAEAEGFIYYIMVTGVTGARAQAATDVGAHVQQLRTQTDLPIAVGFGVSNGTQAREVAESADAVVVGSALIRAARENHLGALVGDIRTSLG